MRIQRAGTAHSYSRNGIEQAVDDEHAQSLGRLKNVVVARVGFEDWSGRTDRQGLERWQVGHGHLDLVQRSENGDHLGQVHLVHVDIDMEQSQSLDSRALFQLAEGGVVDLVADAGVAKLQPQLLSGEVLQVLLPQVAAGLQGINGQGDEGLLLRLKESSWILKI